MATSKALGIPLIEGLPATAEELPSNITYMVLYRAKLDSFYELPKDKRPPRDLWNKSFKLQEYLDQIWDTNKSSKDIYTYNTEDVE